MNWPTMSDYQEAIQNPSNCFSDAQLKAGSPALNALGLPLPVTGGFCSVYQVSSGKSRWAVRCFLHNIRDLRDRYAKISGYLRWKRVRQMVGFEYVPEGIRIRKDWHPVLKMEWVDGDTLNTWVDKHVKDGRALRRLDDRWAELVDALEKANIGHCDFQHGNILVDATGHIRLIDYDGMYVPPLKGRGSHEKGHPAYQHPQREGRDFDEKVDRFPALVIHTSLVALAESPELWKKYYDEDNLIFKRSDFVDPDGAPVFRELERMGGVVAERAELLRKACKRKLGDAPRLREVRDGKNVGSDSGKVAMFPLAKRTNVPGSTGAPDAQQEQEAAAQSAQAVAGGTQRAAGGGPVPHQAPRASAAPAAPPRPALVPPPAPRGNAAPPKPQRQAPPPRPPQLPPSKAKHAQRQAPKLQVVPPPARPASPGKPTGSQPAWMGAKSAPPPPPPKVAPPPKAAPPPAPKPVASAPPKHTPLPPPVKSAPRPSAPPVLATLPSRVSSQPASTSGSASSASGWAVQWTRPGQLVEEHVWKVAQLGEREAPRRFLGITFGTKREKFVERYDERVEERGYPIAGHRATVTALAFTPDGQLLASGSRDGTVRVWHVQSGREALAPLEGRAGVVAMALVPDRWLIAAAFEDRRLALWDFGLHRRVIHLDSPDRSPLRAVAVSNDGRWVAAGGANRRIWVWPTDGGAAPGECREASGRVESLAFTPDGGGIVCGTHNGRVELFDRASGASRWSIRTGLGRISALALPPRATSVLSGAAEGTVVRWGLGDGSELQRVRPMPNRLASLAASVDASLILVGTTSGKACLHEMSSKREVALLDAHAGAVTASALAGAGKPAATGAPDGTVRVWGTR